MFWLIVHWYFWLMARTSWGHTWQPTQRVPKASLHTGCVHMADATLMLRLHKHSQPHIPEGLHCHLQDNEPHYNRWQEQFPTKEHIITDFSTDLTHFYKARLQHSHWNRCSFAKQTSSTASIAFIPDDIRKNNNISWRWYFQINSQKTTDDKILDTFKILSCNLRCSWNINIKWNSHLIYTNKSNISQFV